jgi:hypothetical protein
MDDWIVCNFMDLGGIDATRQRAAGRLAGGGGLWKTRGQRVGAEREKPSGEPDGGGGGGRHPR